MDGVILDDGRVVFDDGGCRSRRLRILLATRLAQSSSNLHRFRRHHHSLRLHYQSLTNPAVATSPAAVATSPTAVTVASSPSNAPAFRNGPLVYSALAPFVGIAPSAVQLACLLPLSGDWQSHGRWTPRGLRELASAFGELDGAFGDLDRAGILRRVRRARRREGELDDGRQECSTARSGASAVREGNPSAIESRVRQWHIPYTRRAGVSLSR